MTPASTSSRPDAPAPPRTARRLHPRTVRLIQAAFAAIAIGTLAATVIPPRCYTLDAQVEYLAARAWRDELDAFTPLNELAARYFPVQAGTFPHPNPHPPWLTLLALPLTFLPFPAVAAAWLAFNLVVLVRIGRWLRISARGSLALAVWPPLLSTLAIGQLEVLLLALVMLGWRAATARRDWHAGLWLGCAAAIKIYPIFFLVPFAVRRRPRVVLAAAAVFLASQLASLLVVGYSGLLRYYTEILPAVSHLYMHTVLNSAPYGALLRLFGGASDVAPLVHAPSLVVPLALMVSLAACAALATLEPEAAPVAAMVALPAVWNYTVVLALPQIVRLLRSARVPVSTIAIIAAASFGTPLANALLRLVALFVPWDVASSPLAALLLTVQPAGFVGLLALLVRQRRAISDPFLRKEPPP